MTVKTATAALVVGAGRPHEFREIAVPDLEPGAMLVEVAAATLCGTDVQLWYSATHAMPFIPGHECCGTVVEVSGSRVDVAGDPVAIGDRVIFAYPFCGECWYCTVANQPALCTTALRFGREPVSKFPHLDGSCATHQYVPARSAVVKVPDSLSSELASSASCALRSVMHGFDKLGALGPADVVVVQGCGPVGLYATAVATTRGAGAVYVIGSPAARLELARTFGATDVLDLDSVPERNERHEWVLAHTEGRGADVVLQCAHAAAVPEGLDFTRIGGRYVSIGLGGPPELGVATTALSDKMLTIFGVRSGLGTHFAQAIDFLATTALPFDQLLTGRYLLEDLTEAYLAMEALREVKPVIVVR